LLLLLLLYYKEEEEEEEEERRRKKKRRRRKMVSVRPFHFLELNTMLWIIDTIPSIDQLFMMLYHISISPEDTWFDDEYQLLGLNTEETIMFDYQDTKRGGGGGSPSKKRLRKSETQKAANREEQLFIRYYLLKHQEVILKTFQENNIHNDGDPVDEKIPGKKMKLTVGQYGKMKPTRQRSSDGKTLWNLQYYGIALTNTFFHLPKRMKYLLVRNSTMAAKLYTLLEEELKPKEAWKNSEQHQQQQQQEEEERKNRDDD